MISATVILATYNRARTLHAALDSLTRQVVPAGFDWELLVVDNNSSDDTSAVVRSFVARGGGRIRFLFEPRQGKSFALNTAIAEARGEILAFTDDDVVVDPHWLARMVERMREYRCEAAGGRIDPVWTTPRPAWLEMDGRYRLGSVVVSMNCGDAPCWFADTDTLPLGANMAIRAEALGRIGPFRTDLGPTTGSQIRGEDSDICRRLLAAGCRMLYVPDAVVRHPVDDRRLRRAYFRQYYFDQGRALTREEGFDPAVRWWGVPRHLFRRAGARFARWMLSFDGKRRFYHQLQFYYALGRITEARAAWARRRSASGP
jgi:glycosyltransferase involved in cell wall biosynthesis